MFVYNLPMLILLLDSDTIAFKSIQVEEKIGCFLYCSRRIQLEFKSSYCQNPSTKPFVQETYSCFDSLNEPYAKYFEIRDVLPVVLKGLNMQEIQSTPVISNSLISNNRLYRSEILVPVLTWKSKNR